MLFIAKWSSSTFALFDVMHFQEFYILMSSFTIFGFL